MRGWSRPLSEETTVWRWYSTLIVGNTLDFLFTYEAVTRGFDEWNPVLRPILLTPWPVVYKVLLFCLLGYSLWRVTRREPGAGRTLRWLRGAAIIYLAVVAVHALGLTLGS
ncbi:MAG: DUF5658 family protein [Armatimonadota bacterium]|nr:DUF5658 family protein [Armatimonadota bacterium]